MANQRYNDPSAMEPLARPTDPPTENLGKPKSRRRWWLLIPFLILTSLIVLGVLIFAKPESNRFHFLDGVPVLSQNEWVIMMSSRKETYFLEAEYLVDQTAEDLFKIAKDELIPLGWRETEINSGDKMLERSATGDLVDFLDIEEKTLVTVSVSRSATILDRIRLWLRKWRPTDSQGPKEDGLSVQ